MRRKFRDDPNPRGRIDTRPPSVYTAAGMRNLQHDIHGNVVGGTERDGRPFGSFNRFRDKGSLGNPATPGLDENARMNGRAPAVDTANLAGRQALHADMVKAGSGGLTPEMEQRASKLGVSGTSFRRVAGGIPQAPGAIAAKPAAPAPAIPGRAAPAGSPPVASASIPATLQRPAVTPTPATPMSAVQSGAAPFKPGQPSGGITPQIAASTPGAAPAGINRLTGKPMGYNPSDAAAPAGGKALATANIAKLGQAGAVADYQRRDAAEKAGKAQSKWRTATATPPTGKPLAPITGPQTDFRQAAGLPQPSALAKSFQVPPANDYQPVSSAPAAAPVTPPAAPVSQFQSLTTPKPTATPATAAPATPAPAWKQPMTPPKSTPTASFVGNTPAGPTAAQRVATSRAASAKDPANKPTPSWMQGTGLGNTLEWLSKPRL